MKIILFFNITPVTLRVVSFFALLSSSEKRGSIFFRNVRKFYWNTRRRVPEDSILYSHTYGNFKCQLFHVINQCTKILSKLGDLNLRTVMQYGGSHSLFTTEEGKITKYISKIREMIVITKISGHIYHLKITLKATLLFTKLYSVIYRCDCPAVFISMSTRCCNFAVVSLRCCTKVEASPENWRLSWWIRLPVSRGIRKDLWLRGAHARPVVREEEGLPEQLLLLLLIYYWKKK